MNRIFKVIFSKATGTSIAASELAKAKTGKSVTTAIPVVAMALLFSCLSSPVPAAEIDISSSAQTQNAVDDIIGRFDKGEANTVTLSNAWGAALWDNSKVQSLDFRVESAENISATFNGSDNTNTLIFSGQDKTIDFSGFQNLAFSTPSNAQNALVASGGTIHIDATQAVEVNGKMSIGESGKLEIAAEDVSLNSPTSVSGSLDINADSLSTRGQLWVSSKGKVTLGDSEGNSLKKAVIENLNTQGTVDFYAEELEFEKRVSVDTETANVTIHNVSTADGTDQKTTFMAGILTGNKAKLTVESGTVVSYGVIQANPGSTISLGSDNSPLTLLEMAGQSVTAKNALLRSYEANLTIVADKVAVSQPQGKEQYALSSFGGNLTIKSDDIEINGKISAGVIEDCFNGRNENFPQDAFQNSSLLIQSLSENGITKIAGDILTYNDETTQNNVSISLSGEASYLNGSIRNLNSREERISATENGTTLMLGDNAQWNVSDASDVLAIQSSGAKINTNGNTLSITNLNNQNSTAIITSSAKADQINITHNSGEGLNVILSQEAADQLNGDAQAMASVLNIGQSDSPYTITARENTLIGNSTLILNPDGTIASYTEQKNTVTDSLQKIGAMNFLTFRAQINDVSKRMGDLRSMPQADGMWARAIAGQSEYKSIHNTYQTLQIGGDKRIGNIYVGGTASYTDGEGKLDNGSTDDKNWSFGLYGGWIADDGQYIDIIIKRHKLDTDFDLHTQSGTGVNGRYHTWGTSASVEYGWRLGIADTDYYIEPQAELMIGHLNGVSHTTNVGTNIKQEGIDTAVGRVGIAAGWISPEKTGSAYLKASVLHDWEGDAKTRVSNKKAMRSYTEDMGGTWGEFALGGTWNINKSLAAYGEVETTAGNPVRTTYQVSGGIRYSF